MKPIRLGVNIDHVATLRQARGTPYPDPVEVALIAERAGNHLKFLLERQFPLRKSPCAFYFCRHDPEVRRAP